jgi:DNA-binding NtrC family response regulator
MITGFASIETVVTAVKEGAEDYLAKPFTDSELVAAVRDTLQKVRFRRAANSYGGTAPIHAFGLVGESEAMHRVYDALGKAASTSATVLITGESGTGKELVARGIHYHGARARAPFVPINCGGIPESLLESELFGQVLQDGEIRMVGGTQHLKVDVRVIAATNKNLLDLVRRQLFREDLYFRVNVIAIDVPPLRDRDDDVMLLARHFVLKYSDELGKGPPQFSDSVLEALRSYHWPGNVRELENVIHRLLVMSEGGAVDVADLPSVMRFSVRNGIGRHRRLAEIEVEHVRNVLASVDGNKTQAAEILGIDRKTLREKLKRGSVG